MSVCGPIGLAIIFLGAVFSGVGAYHLWHEHFTEGWLLVSGGGVGAVVGMILLILWLAFGRNSEQRDYHAPYARGHRRGGNPWGG